jgi:hypothetical protein
MPAGVLPELREQFRHRLSCRRVAQPRGDRRERLQDETPLAETRVRNDEAGLVDDQIAEQHEVQIERTRGTLKRPFAASRALDGLQGTKQVARGQPSASNRCGVQERGSGSVDWRRLVERRRDEIQQQAAQFDQRELEMRPAVTLVGAERDGAREAIATQST